VVDSTLPNGDLALLTDALDEPGTDLREMLTMFTDHLAAAEASVLGVTITLILDGVAVTLSDHDADVAVTSNASLNLPFSAFIPDVTDSTMVHYAAEVGAFADLTVVVTRSAGGGEHVPARGHPALLRSGHSMEVTGLAEFSARNQAIGVLIDQGYPPDEARTELRRRASRDKATLDETAQNTLDQLTVTTNRTEAAKARTRGTRLPARRPRTRAAPGADLTARERDVLRLLVAGLSTVAIAAALLVLPGTVGDHIHSIMTKLGAHSRVETIAITHSRNVLGAG
jgi:DNA-binding CsgD family transcriptional regulator